MARKRGMRSIGDAAAGEANEELATREAEVLKRSASALETLRPRVRDEHAFNQLVAAVQASTRANESVAELQARIRTLGEGVVAVAKQVAGFVT